MRTSFVIAGVGVVIGASRRYSAVTRHGIVVSPASAGANIASPRVGPRCAGSREGCVAPMPIDVGRSRTTVTAPSPGGSAVVAPAPTAHWSPPGATPGPNGHAHAEAERPAGRQYSRQKWHQHRKFMELVPTLSK